MSTITHDCVYSRNYYVYWYLEIINNTNEQVKWGTICKDTTDYWIVDLSLCIYLSSTIYFRICKFQHDPFINRSVHEYEHTHILYRYILFKHYVHVCVYIFIPVIRGGQMIKTTTDYSTMHTVCEICENIYISWIKQYFQLSYSI